jgi:hypothetical protein
MNSSQIKCHPDAPSHILIVSYNAWRFVRACGDYVTCYNEMVYYNRERVKTTRGPKPLYHIYTILSQIP